MIRTTTLISLAALAFAAVLAAPAMAATATADAAICSNTALSTQDQTDCKDKMAAAKTSKDRAKVRADYQKKIKSTKK